MKFSFILVLVSLGSQLLNGQDSVKKLGVGVSVTPQLGMLASTTDDFWESEPAFCGRADFELSFRISDRLKAMSGIGLQKANINQRDYSPNFPADYQNGEVLVKLSYYEFLYDYLAMGIPLGIELALSEKPHHLYLQGSLITRYVIDHEITYQLIESGLITHPIELEGSGIEMRKMQFLVSSGIGYSFRLNQKQSVSIGASLEYSLRSILNDESITLSHQEAGGNPLFFGLRVAYSW
jgi:hypothetical protein